MSPYIKWNTRASLLYAVGAWTMVGSVCYYSYKDMGTSVKVVEEEKENITRAVYKNDHFTAVVTRDKNFVPFYTRIYNMFTADEPGSGAGGQ